MTDDEKIAALPDGLHATPSARPGRVEVDLDTLKRIMEDAAVFTGMSLQHRLDPNAVAETRHALGLE
jgi:hypothetical protein